MITLLQTETGDIERAIDANGKFSISLVCGKQSIGNLVFSKLLNELPVDIMSNRFTTDPIRRVIIRDLIRSVDQVTSVDLSRVEFNRNGGVVDLGAVCFTVACEQLPNCEVNQ